jgi:hypothetical protein
MRITEHQVGTVIKNYLKNRKDRLANDTPFSEYPEVTDQVRVSEEGKKVLYERMGRLVLEKVKNDLSST